MASPEFVQRKSKSWQQRIASSKTVNVTSTLSSQEPEEAGKIISKVVAIALPTIFALAVEPIGSLVSTAFIGHIGSAELAGVGVALSVYNSFTKLFNMPLLAIITSIIGSEMGKQADKVSDAILSSLFLALLIGSLQSLFLFLSGRIGLELYGAIPGSEIFRPASQYLVVRTIGNCATVSFVSFLGIFRGLGDAISPLIATLSFTSSTIMLEYIFLFWFGWGALGAALAVVVAQILGCCIQLICLIRSNSVSFRVGDWNNINKSWSLDISSEQYKSILNSLGLTCILMSRTFAVMLVYASACGILARFGGAIVTAAHQIAFQIWLASSLVSDSLAVASQALISRYLGQKEAGKAKMVASVCFKLAVGLGCMLTITLMLASLAAPRDLFTSNEDVLAALYSVMPMVIGSQVVNSIAFVLDGIVYGCGRDGFVYAAKSMFFAAIPSIGAMFIGLYYCLQNGLEPIHILQFVWAGLLVLMLSRSLTMYFCKVSPL